MPSFVLPADLLLNLRMALYYNKWNTEESEFDTLHVIMGTKTFATACGPKEAVVCIFRTNPTSVYAAYTSEGRNILAPVYFNPSRLFEAVAECEKIIDESFARRLHLLGVVVDLALDKKKP